MELKRGRNLGHEAFLRPSRQESSRMFTPAVVRGASAKTPDRCPAGVRVSVRGCGEWTRRCDGPAGHLGGCW